MDGHKVNPYNKVRGPKAVVVVSHQQRNYVDLDSSVISQDTVFVSLTDSVLWLEMEKNTVYSVCAENSYGGVWTVVGFNYRKQNDNCIQLYSGNYVKTATINYSIKKGIKYTYNLLIGMKYIDLGKKKQLLGFRGPEYEIKKPVVYLDAESELNNRIYPDSIRYEKIDETLAVDKYMVTECEFIQTLWDSIPTAQMEGLPEFQKYWMQKKRASIKGALCDAHDSAAIRIPPYLALVYANLRSVRDGLKPVYSFSNESSNDDVVGFSGKRRFGMLKEGFCTSCMAENRRYILVSVNNSADGYRLPYYNEWMALARGGQSNYRFVWGDEKDSVQASRHAWFGVRDIDDKYVKMEASKTSDDKFWLKYSCGKWLQKSRPVGMLQANPYGLFDMAGLVCENVMLPGKSIFGDEVFSCKGGFLSDSLASLNLGSHCDTGKTRGGLVFQGLRLVRKIKGN